MVPSRTKYERTHTVEIIFPKLTESNRYNQISYLRGMFALFFSLCSLFFTFLSASSLNNCKMAANNMEIIITEGSRANPVTSAVRPRNPNNLPRVISFLSSFL